MIYGFKENVGFDTAFCIRWPEVKLFKWCLIDRYIINFENLYWRHFDFVSKFNVGLKTFLLQGLFEPEWGISLIRLLVKRVLVQMSFLTGLEGWLIFMKE